MFLTLQRHFLLWLCQKLRVEEGIKTKLVRYGHWKHLPSFFWQVTHACSMAMEVKELVDLPKRARWVLSAVIANKSDRKLHWDHPNWKKNLLIFGENVTITTYEISNTEAIQFHRLFFQISLLRASKIHKIMNKHLQNTPNQFYRKNSPTKHNNENRDSRPIPSHSTSRRDQCLIQLRIYRYSYGRTSWFGKSCTKLV